MDLHFSRCSVGVSILLSVITCGIYAWVWLYQLLTTLYKQNNLPNNAAVDIVLTIITCGLYGIYLMYRMGRLESGMHHYMGAPPINESILYLILGIFQLHIVVYAIIQSNINTLVDQTHGRGPGPHGPHGGSDTDQWPGSGRLQ